MTTVRLDKIGIVKPGPNGGRREILRDITFSAHSSEVTAIVGPSGGGKSSLLRLINRLSDPTSGTVYYFWTAIYPFHYNFVTEVLLPMSRASATSDPVTSDRVSHSGWDRAFILGAICMFLLYVHLTLAGHMVFGASLLFLMVSLSFSLAEIHISINALRVLIGDID